MKTRYGFVSNSSSTSFVVACHKKDYPKIEVTIVEDLDQFAESVIETQIQLDNYFEDTYSYRNSGWRQSESLVKLYEKYLDVITSGEKIYIINVSNNYDNPVELYLYNNDLEDDMLTSGRVLDSEN